MVIETSRAISAVARELGISETSLGNWVRAHRESTPDDELRCSCRKGRGSGSLSGRTANCG